MNAISIRTGIQTNLDVIFDFLHRNRSYNVQTQFMAYAASLRPWNTKYQRIYSLLHGCAATQSKPDLDSLSETWQRMHQNRNLFDAANNLESLITAMCTLSPRYASGTDALPSKGALDRLWHVLDKTPGFGPKTAALFVKAVVNIHQPPAYGKWPFKDAFDDLAFLSDFQIDDTDKIRVPVDAVIRYIFENYVFKQPISRSGGFQKINDLIFVDGARNPKEAVLWDDLWFWGFITQHGGGNNRKLAVNAAKFWSIYGAPKEKWDEINIKANEFISLLNRLD